MENLGEIKLPDERGLDRVIELRSDALQRILLRLGAHFPCVPQLRSDESKFFQTGVELGDAFAVAVGQSEAKPGGVHPSACQLNLCEFGNTAVDGEAELAFGGGRAGVEKLALGGAERGEGEGCAGFAG